MKLFVKKSTPKKSSLTTMAVAKVARLDAIVGGGGIEHRSKTSDLD